jgi:hypothetical protein
LHRGRDALRIMLHALEANVHAECSSAIRAKEPLYVSCLVVTDTKSLEFAGMTEDASIYLDRLNHYILSNFLAKLP